jgi:SulP family sulfate permease
MSSVQQPSFHRQPRLAMLSPVRPWVANISSKNLKKDALAGLTNAAIVLPQGVAFAIIAGLPPEYGLYTAMVTAIIAAWWGSSAIMVSGPTTAISAILFASLSNVVAPGSAAYISLALTMTFLVGVLQLGAGLARFGGLISFISHSVIVGFTAAAALLIAASQLGGALGIETERGGGVFERLIRLVEASNTINPTALLIAAVTLGALILLQRLDKRLPSYLFALGIGSVAALVLGAADQGIRFFAPLPSVVPGFAMPDLSPGLLLDLLPAAAAIACVGLLEAISIGRSFALRRKERYDPNQEIVGQGLSNLSGSFFQAYAGSGSFTRSGLNAESGACTPMAAIFAAFMLLIMLFFIAPLVVYIPVPAMSGIILFVAWRLIDFKEVRHILTSRSETVIFGATFLTGVLTELELSIVVGVIGSLTVFLYRSAHPFVAVGAPVEAAGERVFRSAERYGLQQCPEISVNRVEGNIFFASVEEIERRLRSLDALEPTQKTRILGLKGVGKIDLSGADFVINEIRNSRARGGDFHLIAVYPALVRSLDRLGVTKELGAAHLHSGKRQAIEEAVKSVDPEICRTCKARVFRECAKKPGHPEAGMSSPLMKNE